MKHAFILFFAFILFILGATLKTVSAQVNIEANLVMPANPSPYFSDWQSNPQTLILNAIVTGNYPKLVKLATSCSLNGQIVARTKFDMMRPITLHQGMNSFNGVDLVPFSAIEFLGSIDQSAKRTGKLPEGQYQFCIAFVDAETNIPLPGSICNPFAVQNINPVTLISPANGTSFNTLPIQTQLTPQNLQSVRPITLNQLAVLDKNALANLKSFDIISGNRDNIYTLNPINSGEKDQGSNNSIQRLMEEEGIFYHYEMKNVIVSDYSISSGEDRPQESVSINFSWLPPMPAPATPVQYRLRIVPLLPGQTPGQALQTATPLFEHDGLSATTFNGSQTLRQLFSLRVQTSDFAWSIQAHDINGNAIGANNGWAIPNTFTFDDTPSYVNNKTINDFFDIFCDLNVNQVDVQPEPCGYHYKERMRTMWGPWKMTKSYSQYANTYTRIKYGVYRIFTCSLFKGHSGPHHGGATTVYVKEGEEKQTVAPPGPEQGSNAGVDAPVYLLDDPAKKDQMDKKEMDKIPTKDEADKKEADEKKNTGGTDKDNGQNSGTNGGTTDKGKTDDNGGVVPGNNGNDAKEPCPEIRKTLLRTVTGSWQKGATEIKHAAYKKTVVAWATVTWTRTIWNVYLVQHCTLEKDHPGPHVWDAGHEEWQKYGTITDKVTYSVGEPQTEPRDHWSDGKDIPHEDPPRNAVYIK